MNGAETLVRTLLAGGVEVCFANPGTSEMHFVGALDRVDGMRCVLGLFEGVVTGAADGYARMVRKPAATLLHLGPGLGNGLANLHNAKRARAPIVNVVGDHAVYHRQYDAPLTSDVEGTARPYSHWVRTSCSAREVASDAAEALVAARTYPGSIATLILAANAAWDESDGPATVPSAPIPEPPDEQALRQAIDACRIGARTGLILGGAALYGRGLTVAGRIAAHTGVRLLSSYSVPRLERGVGCVSVVGIPYPVDAALRFLGEFDKLVLLGGSAPVSFFAYPGKPSVLTPQTCEIVTAAQPSQDVLAALDGIAQALMGAARSGLAVTQLGELAPATGAVTAEALGRSIAAMLPDGAILIDESVTSGAAILNATAKARRHDLLKNVGGSIGFALPAAVGAAVACPDRKVVVLSGDGSAMYTLQALWTQARERLSVVNVIFANRRYEVLRHELANVGAGTPGAKAQSMLDIGNPTLDWCSIGMGMGVQSTRVTAMEQFNQAFVAGLLSRSPHLIEVVL